MSGRTGALILALAFLASSALSAELIGSWRWESEAKGHGGYSAIEIADGGLTGTVLSDRGRILDMRISRSASGRITGVSTSLPAALPPPKKKRKIDTEGLAIGGDGRIWISTEGTIDGLLRYDDIKNRPMAYPQPEGLSSYDDNRRLEGLAIAPDGTLWAAPEAGPDEGFRIYLFCDERWKDGPILPRRGEFVPVGLDFDDQGRLYLLERDLEGVFGFRTRVRRFTLDGEKITAEEELLSTLPGLHDNLEGIAVWRDPQGALRLTMVSDDNFFLLQKTEIVEYAVPG